MNCTIEPGLVIPASRFICDGIELAKKYGVAGVETSQDFDRLPDVCAELQSEVSPHFDRSKLGADLPQRAFYQRAFAKDGSTIAIQALRKDELGKRSLDDYLLDQLPLLDGGEFRDTNPDLKHLSGTCVYHGQLVVHEDFRGNDLGSLLIRIAQAMAFMCWNPDVIWGLTNRALIMKGFHARKAYMHGGPHAATFDTKPGYYSPGYWIIWNISANLEHMVMSGHEAFCEETATPQKSERALRAV